MIFQSLNLDGEQVTARAEGHADEVVRAFRDVCAILLGYKGAWRFTNIKGTMPDGAELDSEMEWSLTAKLKN